MYIVFVELCETEGLEKSTRIFTTFTPMLRNRIVPLAIRPFVESRRSRLVAGTDKETPKFAVFFNPFPLRDFPYLTSFAGAEKITLSYSFASDEA